MIPISVGLVLDRENILITHRAEGSHLGGLWEFPGGKAAPDESPEACVRREVLEETGLIVACDRLIDIVTYRYPDRTVTIHFYVCSVIGGALNSSLQNGRWVAINELAELPMPPANIEIVQKLLTEE